MDTSPALGQPPLREQNPREQNLSHRDEPDRTDVLNDDQTDTNEDPWIALGSIRLVADGLEQQPNWMMQGVHSRQPWPHTQLDLASRRGWVRCHFVQRGHDRAMLRIYVYPEDVNLAARGSLFRKDFRRLVKWLIPFIDTAPSTWNADFEETDPIQNYAVPRAEKEESLFYIFNTLESPKPDLSTFRGSSHALRAMEDILNDDILGLRSTLYPYQKRSVATMLQREEHPGFSQDPRKPLYHDLKGKPFYFDIFDGAVAESAELYEEPRGGILAETMGYGKTLICLALILATRGHYPGIPDNRVQHCPSRPSAKMPSLLTLAAMKLRQAGLPWKADFYALRLRGEFHDSCVEELQKYHREFLEPVFNPTTPARHVSKREAERVVRLCSATLVIVPLNLLVQWQDEIAKHIEPGALDVIVLDSSTKVTPDWRQLIKYDVVLITKARFEQEYRDDDLNQGRLSAGKEKYTSPFVQLRWLRVVCDEGHAFSRSASRTNSLAMLNKMSIERLWSISGTPSHTLHGIEVSLPSIDEGDHESRPRAVSSALEQRRVAATAKQETEEVERLRLIVAHFFKIQPWGSMKSKAALSWKKYLSPFDAQGNRRCAPGLRTLLQSLMVRHRLSDIDIDLQLPPLYNRTVYIRPSYYDKLTLNIFTMVLASNAVTSERSDEDYMHHPRNRKHLDMLFSNLRQATFHWTGYSPDEVLGTVQLSSRYLEEHADRMSEADRAILTQAIQAGQRALDDAGWRAFSTIYEMGVYVEGFPAHAAAAWSLTGEASEPLLLGTVQAREAQKYVAEATDSALVMDGMVGAGLRAMMEARERARNDTTAKTKRTSNPSSAISSSVAASSSSESTGTGAGIFVSAEPTLKAHTGSRGKRPANGPPRGPSPGDTEVRVNPQLAQSRILGFTSAKLTYLCSELLAHATKSIVFYGHNNTAFYLSEALDLLGIDFRIYANTLPPAVRAHYLHTFNSSGTASGPRVLLMDIKQAAHGLHVAAASRVYFVGPVWDVAAEAQAIKRAHRIGQTRPVWVETLVLAGTIEERMWRRRKWLSAATPHGGSANGGDAAARRDWLDDDGVVGILKNERFLSLDAGGDELPRLAAVADGGPGQWLFGRRTSSTPSDEPAAATARSDGHDDDQARPRKRVMFA